MSKKRNENAWLEAKKRCRLNEADIKMAKELGMTPEGLIKNIPASNERWKAPVKIWISDLYEERFGRVLTVKSAPSKGSKKQMMQEKPVTFASWDDEDLPF